MHAAADRLAEVRERIEQAARRSGRAADDVRLIAVSKTKPLQAVQALAELGQKDFGESQINEALTKIPALAGGGLEWHFIGHLQSNKTRYIPGNFQWVHSIDSLRLARRVAEAAQQAGVEINLLLQVNVAADPAKHGVASGELLSLVDELLGEQLAGIRLRGLMTIGRLDAGERETRAAFAQLRGLLEQCRQRFGPAFAELSMGMSGDYELAIEEGATMVRVGSALFGERG
ncbi:MAG: YggS family pyridoxal phosphate-dependent enzyme [Thiogranum sp.]|nr:YggS family pyridoxal phosphate-dependent enzyme [Thiogranum sp.]